MKALLIAATAAVVLAGAPAHAGGFGGSQHANSAAANLAAQVSKIRKGNRRNLRINQVTGAAAESFNESKGGKRVRQRAKSESFVNSTQRATVGRGNRGRIRVNQDAISTSFSTNIRK